MYVSLYRVPTVPTPTLCYSVLKQIQKCRPQNSCGRKTRAKYECASEPNLWEVLVSAYSHGLSAKTYNECIYNFSRCYQPNTFVSMYFANVCRQRSRE